MLIKLFLLYLIIVFCFWIKIYFFDEDECDFKPESLLYLIFDFIFGYLIITFVLIPIYLILEVCEIVGFRK